MDDNKKTVGYIRVSTREQATEGISLDNQRAKIENYAGLKDLDLIEIIDDSGYSGKDMNREGLKKLIRLCLTNEVDHIVVYKLDRLTRKTRDLLYLIEDVFTGNDIKFHSIQETVDTTTAMGKFFLTIIGAVSQMERDMISERTIDALKHKKETGFLLGREASLGYKFNEERTQLIPIDEEQRILKIIKDNSKKKLQDIADLLNEKGYQGKRGGKFHPSTIHYILKNE